MFNEKKVVFYLLIIVLKLKTPHAVLNKWILSFTLLNINISDEMQPDRRMLECLVGRGCTVPWLHPASPAFILAKELKRSLNQTMRISPEEKCLWDPQKSGVKLESQPKTSSEGRQDRTHLRAA